MLPAIAADGLADAVDAFCEGIAFSRGADRAGISQRRRPSAFRFVCMPISCRTCTAPRSPRGSARFRPIISNMPTRTGVAAMARAGTVAVVLPGAFYFIREKQLPPIDAMRRHRVPIALATDSNPGTSPLTSLLLTMNMGATLFRLTVDECIAAVTREAARALGLFERDRKPGRRQMLRSGDLGYRAAGRTGLPNGLQSASLPGVARAFHSARPAPDLPLPWNSRHDPHRQCPRDPRRARQPTYPPNPGSPKRRCGC